jgi:YD repeat-containing protein
MYDSSGAPNGEVRYVYNDEGRLVAERHINSGGQTTTPTTYTYDGAAEKVKIHELDSLGKENVMMGIEGTNTIISASNAQRVETRYDARGDVVEVKVLDTAGALVSRVEITRDALGNPLEEVQYVGDAFDPGASDSCSTEGIPERTEEQKAEFETEIGRMFSPGTVMFKHTHRYDAEGRLIESKLSMMGMDASRQTFAYDALGNKSEEVSYNQDGTLGTKAVFAREYDERGNWTRELVSTASTWDAEFGLSIPVQVTRRIITYW